jgi:hypothetical protein
MSSMKQPKTLNYKLALANDQPSVCQGISSSRRKKTMKNEVSGRSFSLLGGLVLGALLIQVAGAQSGTDSQKSAPAPGKAALTAPSKSSPTRYRPDKFAGRARMYYAAVWGVDALSVKAVESGELIRFSYEVLDPSKAKAINDKETEAFLIAPDAHAQLVIPTLEKVGKLRQSSSPEAGRSYWMAFSNPTRTVKRGDRVNVSIGQFHADGLVVE